MGFGDWAWILGAGLALVGSVCSNFGVNIQKYSFMQNSLKPLSKQVPYFEQGGWQLGLGLIIFGSFGDFAALGFAAQSIVAPMGSVTLVANIFFAHYWLKEEFHRSDLLGTALILSGSLIAVGFGDHGDDLYTMDELVEFYAQTSFLIYAVCIVVFMGSLYAFAKWIEPLKLELVEAVQEYEQAVREKASDAILFELDLRIAKGEARYKPYRKVHPFCYCAISGMCGANNILFGKMGAELLVLTFAGQNQLKYFLTYVFFAAMFLTIVVELHFLAKALNWFDALYVVPVFQCFWVGCSTIGGACYFQEFSDFSYWQGVFFPVGICVELLGVLVLSQRKQKEHVRGQHGPLKRGSRASSIKRLSVASIPESESGGENVINMLSSEEYNPVPVTGNVKSGSSRRSKRSESLESTGSERKRRNSISEYVTAREDGDPDPTTFHDKPGSLLDWNPASGMLTTHFDVGVSEMEQPLIHHPIATEDNLQTSLLSAEHQQSNQV